MTPSLIDAVRATLTDEVLDRIAEICHQHEIGTSLYDTRVEVRAVIMPVISPLLAAETERRAQAEAALKYASYALTCADAVFTGELGREWADVHQPEYDAMAKAQDMAHAALTAGGPDKTPRFTDGRDARCECEVYQTCEYCTPNVGGPEHG